MTKVNIKREGGMLMITGKTSKPVIWEFTITLDSNEFAGIVRVATRKSTMRFFMSSMFNFIESKILGEPTVKSFEAQIVVKVVQEDGTPLSIPVAIDNNVYKPGETLSLPVGSKALSARRGPQSLKFSRWETQGGLSVSSQDSESTTLQIRADGTLVAKYRREDSTTNS